MRSWDTYGALLGELKKVRKAELGSVRSVSEASRIEGCKTAQRLSSRSVRRAASRLPQLTMV